jgi:outer membrane protein
MFSKNKNSFLLILFSLLFLSSIGFSQTKKWTLEDCVKYAVLNNISVKQIEIDGKTAEIDKKVAKGAFLPNINANANHSWNIGLNQNITTGLLENQTTQFTSAGLNSNINIYNGLQAQNRLRRANLEIIGSQYQLTKIKEDIALNVANAYLQILFNKENIKVQNEQLLNNQKQMSRTQELVSAGSIPRGDLLDMKATVATNKQAVVVAENALLISKLSLAQLLQLDDFQNFDIADTNSEVIQSQVMLQTPESIFNKAKEQKIELKIARANLELAQKDIEIAKGALKPSLTGFYSLSTRAGYSDKVIGAELNPANPTTTVGFVEGTNALVLRPNYSPVFGKADGVFKQFNENKGHSFGLQLNVPILNGYSVRNNIERAKLGLERSKIALSKQELDLERSVFTAFTDAKGSLNAYETAATALEARTEAFNYAKEKFAVGLMNSFELNQAQTLFINSQSELLRTKYDYIFRTKILEFYFGIPIIQN